MKIIVSNPSVGPHVQQTVTAYNEAGYLDTFSTTFFEHPDYQLSTFLKRFKSIEKEIERRSFKNIPIEKFQSRPVPELMRTAAARVADARLTDWLWEWAELSFDNWVANNLSKKIDAVHVYEHAGLSTLKRARQLDIFTIYEQPSQHHSFFNKVVLEQLALYPELSSAKTDLLINSKSVRRNQRRDAELSTADMVICNSTFTKSTLVAAGVRSDKINVIPLAFPPVVLDKHVSATNKPVKFLYAGNQSLRKASHLLYEAWRICNFHAGEAELWLIGKMSLPEELRQNLPGKVVIKNNIPHTELMKLYSEADVFILPSLAEGFGMVVTEAMSQGVPVIASNNSCGPDVIDHMENGWIVPAGDIFALVDQMKWCVDHADQLAQFSVAAIKKAAAYQWHDYRQALVALVHEKWQQFKGLRKSV